MSKVLVIGAGASALLPSIKWQSGQICFQKSRLPAAVLPNATR